MVNEMNKSSRDFINLISCFLNGESPNNVEYNWKEIYNLAKIHDVLGIIATEIKLILPELQPFGKMKSYFNQSLGLTVRAYYSRCSVKEKLTKFLNENKIDHIFVKGCEVCAFYPQPELRTSGDVDVIVRNENYDKVTKLIKAENFDDIRITPTTVSFKIDEYEVEVHKGADVHTNYFSKIFDMCEKEGYEYKLDNYGALLYVLLHIAKHLKSYGAGVRMLMDVDVCVRSIDDFDEQKFMNMCEDAGALKCCQMILSLCKFWFDTPVRKYIDFTENQSLITLLENCFLYGGTFGYYNKNIGSYYLMRSTKGKIGIKEKIKAVFILLFPKWEIIRKAYKYSEKYNFLTPIAYLNRLFDGIFKRGEHSISTVKQIMSSNEEVVLNEAQVIKELELDV